MFPYNNESEESIYDYAKKLEGRTFGEAIKMGSKYLSEQNSILQEETSEYYSDINAKGSTGHLIEKYYFGYDINNSDEPDFVKVGMEMKVTPLKKDSKNKLSSKERMVLTVINYDKIINEHFETSHLMKKARKILMIFYLHDSDEDKLNYLVKNVYKYEIPEVDLPIIRRDWSCIVNKIKEGRAHELSEADTLFLGACTKGVNKNSRRNQPYSDIDAMPRAFSFKNSYVNYIYKNYVLKEVEKEEKLIKNGKELDKSSFESIIQSRINNYHGMTEQQLKQEFNIPKDTKPKNIFSMLTFRMLGICGNSASEFKKANIVVKTIRLNQESNLKESMSLKPFKFMDIINQEWEDSELRERFNTTKFLFVVFKQNNVGEYELRGSQFWNMPIDDIEKELRSVWEKTQKIVLEGIEVNIKNSRLFNNLPSASDNRVCHVRPHAKNKEDTYPTPDGKQFTKQSFWLNNKYIVSLLNSSLLK